MQKSYSYFISFVITQRQKGIDGEQHSYDNTKEFFRSPITMKDIETLEKQLAGKHGGRVRILNFALFDEKVDGPKSA